MSKKIMTDRYYYNPINFESQGDDNAFSVYNYKGEGTALTKMLGAKGVGIKQYLGESRNGNVYLEVDPTLTIRTMEIKDQSSKTLPLEIAEALDKAKVAVFTAMYENNEGDVDFDEYLETAINFSKHRDEEYLDDYTSQPLKEDFDLKNWYKLYCDQVEPIYVEEFVWLLNEAWCNDPDDKIPYSPDTPWPPVVELPSDSNYYNSYKNNPNPFTKDIYKDKGFYKL